MTIQGIDVTDIQRITSGQVIIDLVSIVKELVENSIDANSSKVEINFKNHGLESIEIVDDGIGIDEEDFGSVCLKHHTSKLTSFEELNEISTLGFRGEALSSLCSVSNLLITTCTKENYPKATELKYDEMGTLINKKKVIGGSKGTTISVSNLFHNLPVRQKNLVKNIKKEFNKAIHMVTNYVFINPRIRFTVYNTNMKTNKKNLMLSTKGTNSTILDNMVSVFGSNGSYGLVPLDINVENLDVKFKLNRGEIPVLKKLNIRFTGYISNCSFGLGRSSSDRQYVFINDRPIISKKFLKTINEVYKTFNHVQYPVVILNLVIDSAFLDVNVSPDKRVVMLQNEDAINDVLRDELVKLFNNQNTVIPKSTYPVVNNFNERKISVASQSSNVYDGMKKRTIKNMDHNSKRDATQSIEIKEVLKDREDDDEKSNEEGDNELTKPKTAHGSNIQGNKVHSGLEHGRTEHSDVDIEGASEEEETLEREITDSKTNDVEKEGILNVGNLKSVNISRGELESNDVVITLHNQEDLVDSSYDRPVRGSRKRNMEGTLFVESEEENTEHTDKEDHASVPKPRTTGRNRDVDLSSFKSSGGGLDKSNKSLDPEKVDTLKISIGNGELEESPAKRTKRMISRNELSFDEEAPSKPKTSSRSSVHNLTAKLDVCFEDILSTITERSVATKINERSTLSNVAIDNIESTKEAEEKLSYTILKSDFLNMNLIGQFNLGFILVTLNSSNNLFIVDQHASDEKYNFEKLTETTTFQNQSLVIPKVVELNIIDEMLVMENLSVFKQNGFIVHVDEDNVPGQRIKLTTLPVLKNVLFDISDFHELIHLINTHASTTKDGIKCSKIRTLLALRACRSSIMIGQHLNRRTMNNILKNLSKLDKPWNCPHGRPTMRHLIELQSWSTFFEDYKL